jgi:hypothetical protein
VGGSLCLQSRSQAFPEPQLTPRDPPYRKATRPEFLAKPIELSRLATGFHSANSPVDLFEELEPVTSMIFVVERHITLSRYPFHDQITGRHARGKNDASQLRRFRREIAELHGSLLKLVSRTFFFANQEGGARPPRFGQPKAFTMPTPRHSRS